MGKRDATEILAYIAERERERTACFERAWAQKRAREAQNKEQRSKEDTREGAGREAATHKPTPSSATLAKATSCSGRVDSP